MRRLIWGKTFLRGYQRTLKKHPSLLRNLEVTLGLLAKDPFAASLDTHKLKGQLAGAWACSAGYDLRILFDFCPGESRKTEDILLMDIGTHDEVY
jgi:mRNA-degrading endonuclease YafQ of YafQ-DinJ toxin-antitoxin module